MVARLLKGRQFSLSTRAVTVGLLTCSLVGLLAFSLAGPYLQPSVADEKSQHARECTSRFGEQFSALRARHQDLTYAELRRRLQPEPTYLEALPFDPSQARYFDLVHHRLGLTDQERTLFRQNGFVTVDQGRRLSFPAAYQQIYTSDLPVFITSDSILHALHRSYDEILKELEATWFHGTIDEILTNSQAALAIRAAASPHELRDNMRDVDIYLGVARKLLHTPPSQFAERSLPLANAEDAQTPISYSVLRQAAAIDAIMTDIDSLQLQAPGDEPTKIYGGIRYVDYSQFKPRGHYTESKELATYFRCLMWLGRADCAWNICPTAESPYSKSQSQRELIDAVLLTELLEESGGSARLGELDLMLRFLVGHSDNFGAIQLSNLLQASQITSADELQSAQVAQRLQQTITAEAHSGQQIRSQTLPRAGGTEPTPTPIIFQLFGQRFSIDSFVLSKVVHDEIIFQGENVLRHRPTGLDVMAALGNDEAVGLLAGELEKWRYSANLLACREVVQQLDAEFWSESFHHAWIDSLRSLDDNMTARSHVPAALQTRAWQRKQLQTQLSSWAELRRDSILYAKQSFGVPGCTFPCGYVEPYPDFYAKLQRMADAASRMLGALPPNSRDSKQHKLLEQNRERQVAFFQEMSSTMRMLEQIARDELKGQPQTETQRKFLKETFDESGSLEFGSAQVKDFSGWYCRLFYARHREPVLWLPQTSKPVVADVHTNPDGRDVLEVATGDARLLIIAVEGGTNSTVYVGPISSYYEFWQPAAAKLNDQEWTQRLASQPPSPPDWVDMFVAKAVPRKPESPLVTALRMADSFAVNIDDASVKRSERMSASVFTVKRLAATKNLHALDLSNLDIGDDALLPLANLTDLRSLNLSKTKISDAGVASLKEQRRLQFLDLSGTAISDAVVPSLSDLVYLSQLDLRDTQVTADAVNKLRALLSNTEILH